MDFESKHNPRGLHMWEKIFQPNAFSLDPLAVCSEQAPVSSEAPLIRSVKHSQETNKRIRCCHRGQGQRCGSFTRRQKLSRIYEGRCTGVL